MRLLVLDAYHGGSHAAFMGGFAAQSRHSQTLLTLPARHWKWRMRQAAIGFAAEVSRRYAAGERWQVLVATDMLDLATFIGLAPAEVAALPRLVYFHENQLTYPVRHHDARDHHYGLTNITTCLAADAVVFNSAFHRDVFLAAAAELLAKMPDHRPVEAVATIRARARVIPPGIDGPICAAKERQPGPLRVLWCHRWEYDKDPESFFAAVGEALRRGAWLRLIVVGKRFREVPPVFAQARRQYSEIIEHWGYVDCPMAYRGLLGRADVVVSTAVHEFFGIAVVEAVAAGAYPLVPPRLAYPETLGPPALRPGFFYDGSVDGLAQRLLALASRPQAIWGAGQLGGLGEREGAQAMLADYLWPVVSERLDRCCETLRRGQRVPG